MLDDSLDILNRLNDREARDVDALGLFGAEHCFARERLLNPTLCQGCLKEGPHDCSGFVFREGSSHERMFQGLHDGAIQAAPGVGGIDALGSDAVDPLSYLSMHGFHLVLHGAIWTAHCSEGLSL